MKSKTNNILEVAIQYFSDLLFLLHLTIIPDRIQETRTKSEHKEKLLISEDCRIFILYIASSCFISSSYKVKTVLRKEARF